MKFDKSDSSNYKALSQLSCMMVPKEWTKSMKWSN